LSRFKFENKTILILSQQDWGINMLSKHLYAKELSKNNNVYFIFTIPQKHQTEKVIIKTLSSTLHLVYLKKKVVGVTRLPSFLIDFQTKVIIKEILATLKIKQPDIVWSFEQSRFQNLKQFKAKYSIFHPVDYILQAKQFLPKIANSANIVLSVSEKILDSIQTSTPKYFINHGVDESFFSKTKLTSPPPFIKKDKTNVGYVGNLQMKFIDWKNLIKTVEENATLNFIFIGPHSNSNLGGKIEHAELIKLKSLKNTHFTGAMDKKSLIEILSFFDVFLLCYDHIKFPIEVSNSHKILEYLSTGKVVVSNFISTYKNSDLLEMIDDNEKFSQKLKEVTSQLEFYNSPKKTKQRITFAKQNSYKKLLQAIEEKLS
jgi:hypothetical protein